jgi:exopolyphosphatase/guanosine-5'-triphosphate,3'-diphosphate pyrophosphatase
MPDSPEIIAAVDLGSNSFHMVVARHQDGNIAIIDRLREMVRLAGGLDDKGKLSEQAQQRALECLSRFGQRLVDFKADNVRAVGTNTLRRARNRGDFLDQAERALGFPIEVVAGVEEARLVYLGAVHTLPAHGQRRLVVDIGGGSTELIVGEGLEPLALESLYMGCVGMSQQFFSDGRVSAKNMDAARMHARLELRPVKASFRSHGWSVAIGTSGTIRTVQEVQRQMSGEPHITKTGLNRIIDAVVGAGKIKKLSLPGLSSERAPVFPGGVAILAEVFETLRLETMMTAEGALREGILFDMLGRLADEDARVRTVRDMERRYHVDADQATRVEQTALAILEQVMEPWLLSSTLARQMLCWASRLHEIGLDIAHAQYHRHGAYLLEHADMPGFPSQEQKLLALLVLNHRRKLSLSAIPKIAPAWQQKCLKLIVILRLAVLLNRTRAPASLPAFQLVPQDDSLEIRFPPGWLSEHPLTRADLEREVGYLRNAAVGLIYS